MVHVDQQGYVTVALSWFEAAVVDAAAFNGASVLRLEGTEALFLAAHGDAMLVKCLSSSTVLTTEVGLPRLYLWIVKRLDLSRYSLEATYV